MTGSPLPDWLGTLDQGALAEVLAARPDVCGPTEPAGLGDLAARLQESRSVKRALVRLTRPGAQVAEAAAALGPDATRVRITALLGGPGAAVDEALTALARHALVWPGRGEVLHVAEPLRERRPTRREAAWTAPFDPFPPVLPTVPVDSERVAPAAAARLGEFVGQVARMLAECARRPLGVFKAAGLRPKAFERVMAAAHCDEASARLALACAQQAALLVSDETHVRLSPSGDAFTFLPPGEQAARLLAAWWGLPSTPTRTPSGDGKRPNPLGARADCDGCVPVRRELARVLRDLPDGQGVQAPEDLARTLDWHRPLACDDSGHPPHSALLGEAVQLGLVAYGVLTPYGELLAAGDHAGLARRASRLRLEFADRATIGADLTVTVRGTPSRWLTKELDAVADSLFGPVWRISDESLRRALDAGLSAADIEACFAAVSAAPLPPLLRGKIAEAASGHVPSLRLREVPATCVFRSADTELLARAVRHPALQGLGVRLLAPGVLIAMGPRESVLAALRVAGYPAAEDPVPVPLPPPAPCDPPPDVDALAERLHKAPHVPPPARTRAPSAAPRPSRRRSPLERAQRVITREARELKSDEIRLLARAVAEDGRVRITYVDLNGVETERVIAPPYEMVQLNKKKLLKAICELRSAEAGRPEERVFHYSRIQSVEAADA